MHETLHRPRTPKGGYEPPALAGLWGWSGPPVATDAFGLAGASQFRPIARQVAHNRLSGAFMRGSAALTGRTDSGSLSLVRLGRKPQGALRCARRSSARLEPGTPSVGYGPSVCAWSEAAIDECGEAVEQALQPELEQVLQIEIVIGSGEAFEDGEAARFHD